MLVFPQPVETFLNGGKIREHPTKPPLVDIELLRADGFGTDNVLGLFFGANKENAFTTCRGAADKIICFAESRQRLLQVNDINTIPRPKDIAFHLRVPAICLVAKMGPGL